MAKPPTSSEVDLPHAGLLPTGQAGIALSAVSQLAAKVVHLGLNVVSSLALIHYLSPADYGEFVLVITVSALSGLLGDFGLARLAVRDIAQHPDREEQVVGSVVGARLLLATAGIALNQLIVLVMGSSGEVRLAALVISLLFWCEAVLSVVVVFHVRLQQHYEAAIRVGMEATETALILVLIARGAGLVALMVPPVATAAVGAGVAAWLVRRRVGRVPPLSTRYVRPLLVEASPIAAALVLAAVYLKIGSVLVAALSDAADVGLYGAAYQPIEYLLLASAVVINVLLPLLSRSLVAHPDRFESIYRRGTEVLLAGTLPVALILVWTAPALARAVYGDDFAGAAPPLRILSIALVALVVSFWQATVLLAGGHQRVTMVYDICSVVSVVTLSVVLIPSFGPAGAATAVLVTSFGVAVVSTRATARRLASTPDPDRLVRIALAGLAMGVCLAVRSVAPLGVVIGASIAVYVGTLWALGIARRETVAELIGSRVGMGVAP